MVLTFSFASPAFTYQFFTCEMPYLRTANEIFTTLPEIYSVHTADYRPVLDWPYTVYYYSLLCISVPTIELETLMLSRN